MADRLTDYVQYCTPAQSARQAEKLTFNNVTVGGHSAHTQQPIPAPHPNLLLELCMSSGCDLINTVRRLQHSWICVRRAFLT